MRHNDVNFSLPQWLLFAALAIVFGPVRADVITDWNQKALAIVTAYSLSAPAYRDGDDSPSHVRLHQRDRAAIPAV